MVQFDNISTDIQLPSSQLEVELVPMSYFALRHASHLSSLPANLDLTWHLKQTWEYDENQQRKKQDIMWKDAHKTRSYAVNVECNSLFFYVGQ